MQGLKDLIDGSVMFPFFDFSFGDETVDKFYYFKFNLSLLLFDQ